MFGIIYKLSSPDCEKVYIGSTSRKNLNKRYHEHKQQSNPANRRNSSSQFLFNNYDNVVIEQLEKYEDISKLKLKLRELENINNHNSLNQRKPLCKKLIALVKEDNILIL